MKQLKVMNLVRFEFEFPPYVSKQIFENIYTVYDAAAA
jgi:hypothetical protein